MNAYHNLAGWLRDVGAILNDRTDLAISYRWRIIDLLHELLELEAAEYPDEDSDGDGADVTVSEELELEDGDDDVPVRRSRDGGATGTDTTATRTGRSRAVGRTAGMADEVPRDLRRSLEARSVPGGDTPSVARAGAGVKRSATVEMTLAEREAIAAKARAARVPRGTSRRTKKGGKRATRKASR